MALCLAESLIECREFDPVDQLDRYVRWWRDGHLSSNGNCFDIGNAVRAALSRFERTREPWCGSTAPSIATACRMNCRAASASASAWRGRWPQGHASC